MTSLSKGSALRDIPSSADRIDQLFDTVGDGSGTTEQAAAAAEYKYRPAPGTVAVLERVNAVIETASRIGPDLYADLTALTNGILITIKDSSGGVIHTFTPQPIKVTYHWSLLAGTDVSPSAFAAGADSVSLRWTLSKGGQKVVLNGDKGEYMSVDIRDTLAGLTSQLMHVQGYLAR